MRCFSGSPPRMRGKVFTLFCVFIFLGITPAYAGKSTRPFSSGHENGDHPRVCGEKCTWLSCSNPCVGSPPRMRGKAFYLSTRQRAQRITPAYAGKRVVCPGFLIAKWDHPRVCGEKAVSVTPIRESSGSPPRMRGKETYCTLRMISPGITPAYAGKRLKSDDADVTYKDHPRVCGEKTKKIP